MQPDTDNENLEIHNLLYRLGITPNYTGFYYVSLAVSFAVRQPDRLLLITKRLYPEIARFYKTKPSCVERNIRTAAILAWTCNRPLLEEIAKHPLPTRPASSLFLAILSAHLSSIIRQ